MTENDVRALIRERAAEAGSLTKWAKLHGIAPSYVTDVMAGRRPPGEKVLESLGLAKTVVYAPTPSK